MSQVSDTTPQKTQSERAPQRLKQAPVRLILVVVCVGALELLPVMAWLLALAAFQAGDISQTAEPFWLLMLTLAAFWGLLRVMINSSISLRLTAAAVVGVFALAIAFLLPSSPVQQPSGDHLAATAGLIVLVAYLGWRGLSAGHTSPFVSSFERTTRLFVYGCAALVAAIVLTIAAPSTARSELIGALSLCLPAEMLAGLIALALTKAALNSEEARGEEPTLSDEARWFGMAGGLTAFIVGMTLIISLFLNFKAISLGLKHLGPLGALLYEALSLLIDGFVFLLYLIFNIPVSILAGINSTLTKPTPPKPDCVQRPDSAPFPPLPKGEVYCPPHTSLSPLYGEIALVVLSVVLGIVIMIALFYIVREVTRQLLKRLQRKEVDRLEEERESLDARALLSQQLRGLFVARKPKRREETLPQGSVRWLYRETLRAAATRQIVRTPNETPDEFARRLAPSLLTLAPAHGAGSLADAESQADISAFADLNDAYNRARYDEREPESSIRAKLRDRATRLIRRLRGDSGRR